MKVSSRVPKNPSRHHAESLLRIPLVARALSDPGVPLLRRGIDCTWFYRQEIKRSVVGFNPMLGRVYYGAISALGTWLDHAGESARPYNDQDRLVGEVLFAVHDYLHAWAYAQLAELSPAHRVGEQPLDASNIEAFAFLHLLTEACATVGLDYWYLCNLELDELCPIGSTRSTLTVGYHDRYLAEYRRFHPTLDVQCEAFFGVLVDFYCSGEFLGFSAGDMRSSARIGSWLRHEIAYGELQRQYVRRWLHHLAGLRLEIAQAARPIVCSADWQRRLIRHLSERLWALVKHDTAERVTSRTRRVWRSPPGAPPDFALMNINSLDDDALDRACADPATSQSFDWLFGQLVSRFDYARFDLDKLPLLPTLREQRNWKALTALCKGERRVPAPREDALEIMLLN